MKVNKKNRNFYSNLSILVGITFAIGFFIIAEIVSFFISINTNGFLFTDAQPKPLPNFQAWIITITLLIIFVPTTFRLLRK